MRPGTRILVIEDDDYTARLLKLQLEHRDLDVRCEYDGPSGLKAAARFDPELIVLDEPRLGPGKQTDARLTT